MAQPQPQQDPQATANQGKFNFNIVAQIIKPKTKTGWLLILGVFILLMIAWWRDIWHIREVFTGYGLTISGIIAVSIIIIFIFYGIGSSIQGHENSMANFFIATVFALWLVDLIPPNFVLVGPWLGTEWNGFVWSTGDILHLPWLSILFSTAFFSFLYINMIFNIIEKEYIAFSLGFGFILLTNILISKFFPNSFSYGFNIYIPTGKEVFLHLGTIALMIVLGYGAWRLDKRYRKTAVPEFFSSLFLIFVFTFFWTNNGWEASPRAIMHMAYILGFGFIYMRSRQAGTSIEWKILMPLLLVIDFFGHGFLWSSGVLVLKFIPPLVLFVIIYCYEKEAKSGQKNYIYPVFAFILLVTFFLIMSLKVAGFEEGTLPFIQATPGATFSDIMNQFTTNIKSTIEGKLDVATGGLYRYSGAVEQNQYENLGVYFSNIRASEPKYFNDEPVTIWASIRSKTYQDPVIVNFYCSRWKTLGEKLNRVQSKTYYPKDPFLVFQLEQNDVECTFKENDPINPDQTLNVGQNTVTVSAEYNFATNAYKKSYFIDKDRYRSLIRENIDPFKEYGIQDTQPKPIFTNGPVEIGMDVQPINPVGDSYTVYPTLGITLANRKSIEDKNKKVTSVWEGKIKNITELVVLTPLGIEIKGQSEKTLNDACNPENFANGECPCSRPFKTYTVENCRDSCALQVWNPCQSACEFFQDSISKEKCRNDCTSSLQNCNNECNNLFSIGEGEGTNNKYNGYALVTDLQSYGDKYKGIDEEYRNIDGDRFKTFVCRIKPTPQVLDNTPITTKYFRVRARYNYLLENSVNVPVQAVPGAVIPGVSTSIGKYAVIQYALSQGVDPVLLEAIALQESGARHCKDGSTECPKDQVTFSGSSLGLMQINVIPPYGHPEWKTDASSICGSGKTVYDIDCNIKLGIKILKEKYDQFKNGISDSTLQKFCSPSNPNYQKYKNYRGWDAALRGYNGLGCQTSDADADFVEKIKKYYNDIKNGVISSQLQANLDRITKYLPSSGVKPPTPYGVTATLNGDNSISVVWNSAGTNLKYGVYRYSSDGSSFAQYTDAGQAGFNDQGLPIGDYYYRITSVSDTDESDLSDPSNTISASQAVQTP